MKKLKIFSLILLTAATTSCSDFLTEMPNGAIPQDDAIKTLDDCDAAIIGIYSTFKSSALYSGYMTQLPDIQADLAYLSLSNTGVFADIYRWNINPSTAQITSIYSALYQVISRCNFFFDYADRVRETLTTESEIKTFEKRIGDAYFARALAYSELIRHFCEAYTEENADDENSGVSLALSYVNNPKAIKRSTLRESYAQVISDLENAEKYIPTDRAVADSEYFSPGAVNALQSRIYLYIGEYQKSVDAATQVIKSGIYELAEAVYPTSTGYSEYGNMWVYDSSDEIIWKIAMTTTDRGGALGKIFLNYNGATYSPDYVAPNTILDLFGDTDYRYPYFFSDITAADGTQPTVIRKYIGNPNIDAGSTKYFTNMPKVFRLSEVYLNRAEAYYNLGNTTSALADLTSIRRKRLQGYGSAGGSGEAVMQEIKEERIRELFMEGFRLSDLKRWGDEIIRKKQIYTIDGNNENQLNIKPTDAAYRFTTWPIPQHEIEASNNGVVGNKSNY